MKLRAAVHTLFDALHSKRLANHPERAQRRVWQEIRRVLVGSPYWTRKYSGSIPQEIEEFAITAYEDYEEALARSRESLVSELNGERLLYWAVSSGSSGQPKLLPYTDTYHRQYTRGESVSSLAFYAVKGSFHGKALFFASGNTGASSPCGVEIKHLSNIIITTNELLQGGSAIPAELHTSAEILEEWGAIYALVVDVSIAIGSSPVVINRFLDQLERRREEWLRIIEGTDSLPEGLPGLPELTARRAHLTQVLRSKEPLTLARLWPGLVLLSCWKTSTCSLQFAALEQRIGQGVAVVESSYAASEGIITTVSPDGQSGPLAMTSHVYEFVQAGCDVREENVLKPWHLTPGERYEVLLTTGMGLVRYRLRDLVECTGFYRRYPRIRFVQKVDNEVSLGWVTIGETEVCNAVAGYQESFGQLQGRWFFAPNPTGNGLVFHFQEIPSRLDRLLSHVTRHLSEVNHFYMEGTESGYIQRLASRQLPADHAIWEELLPPHRQAKIKFLSSAPIAS